MDKWKEFKFKLDAYTPSTFPMNRLAEYLAELSKMLGETHNVHFDRLEEGSTCVVKKIDIEAVPKVEARVQSVKAGNGNVVEMAAYRKINRMLLEDNSSGRVYEGRNEIIRFAGKEDSKLQFGSIQQQGEIDGEVIRVGGKNDFVPILLEVEGREIAGCVAKKNIAKDLAKYLFEPVRLFGSGNWSRNLDGEWDLNRFNIEHFEPLDQSPLSKVVLKLRGLEGNWKKNAIDEILTIRHGKKGADK